MKIRIIGGGWYGCHIAKTLLDAGHKVTLYEVKDDIFKGASGANPARLHLGFHYPRSQTTRRMCQQDYRKFMNVYGQFTRGIPVNIYAVAKDDSMVDYANYIQVLRDEVQFIEIEKPEEFGLKNVDGAVLTGERHLKIDAVRHYFKCSLKDVIRYSSTPNTDESYDLTIDCTFCSADSSDIDRYEPCITHILKGDYNKAVTIMDGPFPSLYPHYKDNQVSLTSALYTPLDKKITTYKEAQQKIWSMTTKDIEHHVSKSVNLMRKYYPDVIYYTYLHSDMAIRAMPRSGADSRLWKINKKSDDYWVVRAGKIDAVVRVGEEILKDLL